MVTSLHFDSIILLVSSFLSKFVGGRRRNKIDDSQKLWASEFACYLRVIEDYNSSFSSMIAANVNTVAYSNIDIHNMEKSFLPLKYNPANRFFLRTIQNNFN